METRKEDELLVTPPQGRGEPEAGALAMEVPVKHTGRARFCCGPLASRGQSHGRADVARENISTGSPRNKQRSEAREANRPIWEPVCNLLWATDGTRWSTCTRIVVLLHVVTLANSSFNLYAFLRTWEHRPALGLMLFPNIFSCFLVYVLLKNAHPRDGAFVRMCSFMRASEEEIATNRNAARCLLAVSAVLLVVFTVFVILFLVSTVLDPWVASETKLQNNQYGGHGGTWFGVTSFALDFMLGGYVFMPTFILFCLMLKISSSVAITAARHVGSEIDRADQDIEVDVSEALRCEIGPRVQTLVEEMIVPLSKAWGPAVAASVTSFVALGFANLPTVVDVNSTSEDASYALQAAISCSVAAVIVVYSPAKVTTVCEEISYSLNELRTAGVGTGKGVVHSDTDANICVIETWLSNLNRRQGPGFLLFDTVVSRRLVLTVASKVAGYVTVAVQALQQLQTPQSPVTVVDEQLGIGTYTMTVTGQGTSIVGPN